MKKVYPLVFLLLGLVVAVILVKIRQDTRSKAGFGPIAEVRLIPYHKDNVSMNVDGSIIYAGNPIHFSALAYDSFGQTVTSGVDYQWGTSSTNSIGTLDIHSSNQMATFTGSGNNGRMDIWVAVTGGIKNSVAVVSGPCVRNSSSNLTPADQSGAAGSTLNYTFSITNNDSSSCSPVTISSFGSHNLPAGWSVSFNPSSLTLNPGQTASTTASFTSRMGAVPSFYYVYTDAVSIVNQYTTNFIGRYAKYTVTTEPIPSPTPTPFYWRGDINKDGKVDIFDYNILVADFGK